MRYFACILIGLLVGSIGAVMAQKAFGNRNPYPDALMQVMAHEMKQADEASKHPECADPNHAFDKLDLLAADIPVAMPGDGEPDRVFDQYVADLRRATAAAKASPCAQRKDALTEIGNACKACHRDYR